MIILVVENEPITAFVVARELEEGSHQIIGPVSSAEDALDLATREHIDVALIEIDLGREDQGIRLARALRRLSIPCVFATARSTLAHEYSAFALGYLAKPYDTVKVNAIMDFIQDSLSGVSANGLSPPHGLELFSASQERLL